MILIADSGASKTDWGCVSRDSDVRIRFSSQGYNPNYITGPQIVEDIRANMPAELDPESVKEIYFYGAGLVSEASAAPLRSCLEMWCPFAEMEFHSDILAAARALFGDGSGVVAIMGTGSNSCLYENGKIVRNIRPGGYVLGDEGSGVWLGRAFLADFVKGMLPVHIDVYRNVASSYSLPHRQLPIKT